MAQKLLRFVWRTPKPALRSRRLRHPTAGLRTTAVACLLAAFILPFLLSACGKSIGATMDDATISTRVKAALLNDPDVNALHIDVKTAAGVVTLAGVVRSQAEEQRAVQVARTIQGVKDVKSALQIQK